MISAFVILEKRVVEKMSLIIYGTQYGTSKNYAEKLAAIMGVAAVDYRKLPRNIDEPEVFFVGALYAGRMTGLKKVLQVLEPEKHRLTLVTVGMTDPANSTLLTELQQALRKKIMEKQLELRGIYHLQGAVNYEALALKHKMLIKPMLLAFKKQKPEELDAQAQMMLQAFEKTSPVVIDFVAFAEKIQN